MANQWNLKRGEEILGLLTELDIDQPWIICQFQASTSFASYQPLFIEELKLLDSDEMELWQRAYQNIDELGLVLEPSSGGGETIRDFILHIDGNNARFRY